MDRRLPRQNFPPNLPTKRRLWSTVGGRIVEGGAAHCCAVSAARSRAATMTNLARSSLALVLPALFGAAKSRALVNLFMICPRWSAGGEPTTTNSASDDGRLMACFDWSRPLFWVKFHYHQPPHSSWAPDKCGYGTDGRLSIMLPRTTENSLSREIVDLLF
jgi:hypothetical protein